MTKTTKQLIEEWEELRWKKIGLPWFIEQGVIKWTPKNKELLGDWLVEVNEWSKKITVLTQGLFESLESAASLLNWIGFEGKPEVNESDARDWLKKNGFETH